MIENDEQLRVTLEYVAKFANMLEGMRRYELDRGGKLFPHMAAAPLNEIRTNFNLVRAYVDKQDDAVSAPDEQFAGTLEYMAKWANILEAMRDSAASKPDPLFVTVAAGPLGEIRKNLEEARAYLETKTSLPAPARKPFAVVPASVSVLTGANGKG